MSATAAIVTEKKKPAPKKVSFTLLLREQSSFKYKHNDQIIDYPKHKNILTEDRVMLTEELVEYYNWLNGSEHLKVIDGVVQTRDGVVIGNLGDMAWKRRIKGVSTIWKIEQERRNFLPTTDDSIWLLNGELDVNADEDKGLYLHMMTHNQNADFPYRSDNLASASIKIDDHQKVALTDIEIEELKDQAKEIVKQARNTKTKKFDPDKMAFYSSIFREQLGTLQSDEEKFIALLRLAEKSPLVIINSIESSTVDYQAVVSSAMELQILIREKGKVVNTLTNNTVITLKIGLNSYQVNEKLVEYYSSKEGAAEFTQLKNLVEAHQKELVS